MNKTVRSSNRFLDFSTWLTGLFASLFMWTVICVFFGYIFYQGIAAVSHYGFSNVFLSFQFDLSHSKVSFWAPLGVTAFLALFAVIFTIPIALRCSAWINFTLPKKYRKAVSTFLLVLANIPSVILAMYIRRYLAPVFYQFSGLKISLNLIVAGIALVCMIIPFTILFLNASLENTKHLVIEGEVLGLHRHYSVYKIVFPKIKRTIIVAATFVISRAFSESIMLSMILSSENYSQGYGSGVMNFLNSQLNSVAPLIGENYFADGSSEDVQNLMFLFGAMLLVVSVFLNTLLLEWAKKDQSRVDKTSRLGFFNRLSGRVRWMFYKWLCVNCKAWEHGKYSVGQFIYTSGNIKVVKRGFRFIRKTIEYLCLFIFLLYAFSFVITVIVGGIDSIFFFSPTTTYSGNDTVGRAIQNTLLIVFLSILASLPVALFSAIYLSEYSPHSKFKKYTLSLITASSSTPSIIFGIFGLFVFIQKLGLTASGNQGKSLLAGILTMILFIFPNLTNLFYNHISQIPYSYRESSYILGISKCKTFWKILFPIAFNNLVFSVLLSAGKIMGETALLYLTAGINSSPGTLFMYQGQTLTTRIYSQLHESNLQKGTQVINEASFYCVLFISLAVLLGKYWNIWFNKNFWLNMRDRFRYAT